MVVYALLDCTTLHPCCPLWCPPEHPPLRLRSADPRDVGEHQLGGSGSCSSEVGSHSTDNSCDGSISPWPSIIREIPFTLPRSSTRWSSNLGSVNVDASTRRPPAHVLPAIGDTLQCRRTGNGPRLLGPIGISDNKGSHREPAVQDPPIRIEPIVPVGLIARMLQTVQMELIPLPTAPGRKTANQRGPIVVNAKPPGDPSPRPQTTSMASSVPRSQFGPPICPDCNLCRIPLQPLRHRHQRKSSSEL